jgi:hypothetical protein
MRGHLAERAAVLLMAGLLMVLAVAVIQGISRLHF